MTIRVTFQTCTVAHTIQAIYQFGDFSLNYRHQRLKRPSSSNLVTVINERLGVHQKPDFFVIADTLVVVFAGEEMELVGMDAYTNWQMWTRSRSLSLPMTSGIGKICLTDTFPDDRISLDVVPGFIYSEDQRLLQILLATKYSNPCYYRVSDNLIAGIEGGDLVMLLVHNFSIE